MRRRLLTKKMIGKRVRFKVACRYGWQRGPRIIKGIIGLTTMKYDLSGGVTVRCAGYAEFVVRPHEILSIED